MLHNERKVLDVCKNKDLFVLIEECSKHEDLDLCDARVSLTEHDLPALRHLVLQIE